MVCEAFRFDEGQVPGVAGDEVAAGVWVVGFDAARAKQDADSFTSQLLQTAAERSAGGKG